jgi:ABC-type Fe3+ transport system permease subunit
VAHEETLSHHSSLWLVFGWLLLGLILAIFCALLVVRTTPIDAPGAAPASVNRPA